MSWVRALVVLGATALIASAPVTADAQARAQETRKTTPGQKVVRPEELRIEGQREKAKATPITPPAAASRVDREPRESLLPKILEAAERSPF